MNADSGGENMGMIYYVKALGFEEREDLRIKLIESGYTLGDEQDNERYFSTDLPIC